MAIICNKWLRSIIYLSMKIAYTFLGEGSFRREKLRDDARKCHFELNISENEIINGYKSHDFEER
jgi:hypothetical protein